MLSHPRLPDINSHHNLTFGLLKHSLGAFVSLTCDPSQLSHELYLWLFPLRTDSGTTNCPEDYRYFPSISQGRFQDVFTRGHDHLLLLLLLLQYIILNTVSLESDDFKPV